MNGVLKTFPKRSSRKQTFQEGRVERIVKSALLQKDLRRTLQGLLADAVCDNGRLM